MEITSAQTIGKTLEAAVQAAPDRVGFVYLDQEITFAQMDKASDRVASGFLKMGLQRGDKIGIIALNQMEWLYVYFAAAKIGLAVVGLSVRYREGEFDYMLNHSDVRAIVTLAKCGDFDYVDFFKKFRTKIPGCRHFIFIGEGGFPESTGFDALLNADVDATTLTNAKQAVVPDDLMMIIYTSGTTGTPKGAMITHKSQLASALAMANHTKFTADDVQALAMPLNHVGGITCGILVHLLAKAAVVLVPMFNADLVIQLSVKYQPTICGGVPTMHLLLMMNESFKTWDRSKVRIVIAGGSNAEPDMLKKIKEAFPNAAIMNLYGLSESSGAVIISPWESDFDATVRSIGKPIGDFKAKVVDADDQELPTGETGELCIQGDSLAKGYLHMEKETAEAFRGGWLHTGDMAYIDGEGYIVLKGRKKEMYVQGGFNVYPVEVENILSKHPKIMMAAGIGVPDPVLGEVGRYYIVPKADTNPTEDEIKEYCRQNMADYKVPKQIVFRQELPLTPAGKIMKINLKEEYEKNNQVT